MSSQLTRRSQSDSSESIVYIYDSPPRIDDTSEDEWYDTDNEADGDEIVNNANDANSLCKKCKCSIKRILFPLVGIPGLISLNYFQNFIYIPLFIFFSAVIFFWNFPSILIFNNKKPIYYDELFLDIKKAPQLDIDEAIQTKYKNRFMRILIITNSLLLAGLSDYWLYRTRESTSYIEIAGITGGILKLFQYINITVGNIILYFSRKRITIISDEKTECDNHKEISDIKLADSSNSIIVVNPIYEGNVGSIKNYKIQRDCGNNESLDAV